MEQKQEMTIEQQLESINEKLLFITKEVEHQRQFREQMQDFQDDMMRVAKEAVESTIYKLDEMSDQLNSEKLMHLVKTLARNTDTITSMLEKLEAVNELLVEANPIIKNVFDDFIARLDNYAQKGYFELFRAFGDFVTNFLDCLTPEDVELLTENCTLITSTLRNLLSGILPKLLPIVNMTIDTYREFKPEVPEKISIFKMIGLVKSKEIKTLLFVAVEFLRSWIDNLSKPKIETKTEVVKK